MERTSMNWRYCSANKHASSWRINGLSPLPRVGIATFHSKSGYPGHCEVVTPDSLSETKRLTTSWNRISDPDAASRPSTSAYASCISAAAPATQVCIAVDHPVSARRPAASELKCMYRGSSSGSGFGSSSFFDLFFFLVVFVGASKRGATAGTNLKREDGGLAVARDSESPVELEVEEVAVASETGDGAGAIVPGVGWMEGYSSGCGG